MSYLNFSEKLVGITDISASDLFQNILFRFLVEYWETLSTTLAKLDLLASVC